MMIKRLLFAVSLLLLSPRFPLSAGDLNLPASPSSVQVPAATGPYAQTALLKAEYRQFYLALKFYSDLAFAAAPGSQGYLTASASGQYLRARLEGIFSRITSATGAKYELSETEARGSGEVSATVLAELEEVFGFDTLPDTGTRNVVIKQGYCQVNYVKNNVPFLVQYDGFLKKGEVILTFDDGPGALTEEVSAFMKEAGAPSVFFVLGANLGESGKERIRKASADGHEVAVHGYNHATPAGKPFTALSTVETLRQLSGVDASINAATGKKPGFFRPPYGIISPAALGSIASDLKLTPVGWTIDTLDWSTKDPDELFNRTVSLLRERGKGIVLLHDIHPQSRTAARRLVKWLAENGYRAVPPERLTRAFKGE